MRTRKIYIAGGTLCLLAYWFFLHWPVTGNPKDFVVIKDVSSAVAPSVSAEFLQQQMEKVQSFLEKDQSREALLLVKEILQVDPKNERAKILFDRLSDKTKVQIVSTEKNQLEEQFEAGQKIFQTVQEQTAQGNYDEAYPVLLKLTDQFQGQTVQPTYFSSVLAEKKRVEEKIQNEVAGPTANLQQEMQRQNWKKALEIAEQILNVYPDDESVLSLKDQALQARDLELAPRLMQAETRLQLSGCSLAEASLQSLMEEAAAKELSVWQRAASDYKECQNTRFSQNDLGSKLPPPSN